MDETLEDCAKRELEEETGVNCNILQQFRAYSALKRDPRQRTITVVFYGILNQLPPLKAGDDAAKAEWFNIENLPGLAFDHGMVIDEMKQMKMI